MEPGTVAHFSDGQKAHTGVVLDVSEDGDAWALFLTSNPDWNKRCRPVTGDELALCGFAKKDRVQTYFAPVVRPSQDAYHSGVTFPGHRVLDLSDEFGPSPFSPPAISLPSDIFPPVREVASRFSPHSLPKHIDIAANKLGVADMSDEEVQRLSRFATGLDDVPRSELIAFCKALPGVSGFFTRRSSTSMSLQIRWARLGAILAEHREQKGVPQGLMARRLGVTDRDYRGFENGLLCPSYDEMFTIQAMLPGVPDAWTLPASIPLLADCVLLQMKRRRWYTDNVSSKLRMSLRRVNDILISVAKPAPEEERKLRSLFQGLPPWRPVYMELDGLYTGKEAKEPPA